MDHLADTRPERPGYRLKRLEVFNWGTFDSTDGRVFRFEPEGRTALLVGHNGSGKSTLVDAILTLLLDSRRRNYNVAAGAKKSERTPKTYIKGAFDRIANDDNPSIVRFLRPKGNHLTAISGVFHDEQLGKSFTLTQVLFLRGDGTDDRIYAFAGAGHELKDDLAGLKKSDEINDHLRQLGYQTTRTYVEYHSWLARRTQMRAKAMDMFNQTVAVKDIQSLNKFIRTHMLEVHDWREKVQRLLTHFNDLSLAHQELVRARRAEELLQPVEEIGAKYRKQAGELERLEEVLEAARTFFPSQVIELFEPEIEQQQHQVKQMTGAIVRLDRDLKAKRQAAASLRQEIDQAGGERLKAIPGLIKQEEIHLQHKRSAFTRFCEHLKTCGIDEIPGDEAAFVRIHDQLREAAASSESESVSVATRYEETLGRKAGLSRQLQEERAELDVLEKRRTNLPARFTAMRSQICDDLNLDESVLPFAAELLSVHPDHREWEASAEMVLGSFARSLLVPQRFYPRVRAYVEGHRISDARGEGQRLDYICVGKPQERNGDRIHPQSLFHKLKFKPKHDLTPWVRGEVLRRFDFRCCENIDEFNEVERLALTASRHVKFNSQRHQKDDRPRTVDPRYFVLGWDNKDKKGRIVEKIQELEAGLQELEATVARCTARQQELQDLRVASGAALEVAEFDAIDLRKHQDEIAELKEEERQLEESSDTVRTLRNRLKSVEQEEQDLARARDNELQARARLEDEIQRVQHMVDVAREDVAAAEDSGEYDRQAAMFDVIAASLSEPLTIQNFAQLQKQWEAATRQQIDRLRQPLQDSAEKLVNAMTRFLREFKEEQSDLDASVRSLDSFLGLLHQLREEDLPRHETSFKKRLNDQVSQEVALFNTELREERRRIREKIEQLNKALAAVEYNPGAGTFMRLDPREVQDREIEEFRRSLSECLDESLDEHTDETSEARFLRIQQLVERLGDRERTTWRNKVIDVRNWYDFAAQEIERETGAVRSCYDGSSGQSGGEKAKLAFTILVAALAYQFDVDPDGGTSGRFQFVVVDEMFSKVDDQNAVYALKLFRQFGLQLLIVAPLDAKARITEPFVDRYLHVVKDEVTSRSELYSMTAQEYESVVKELVPGTSTKKSRRRKSKTRK